MKLIQITKEIGLRSKGDKAMGYESVNEIRANCPETTDNNLAEMEQLKLYEGELFVESDIHDHFIIINKDQYCIID